ncbi:MAG: spondin domain-containing protein [Cyanobacteria bacterium P01_A01_bin.84]
MAQKQVTVTIENLAPENGTFLTPFWVGFHNGNFDTYDRGRPVSPGLESLAEDGETTLISQEFALSGDGSVDGTILGSDGAADGPIDPTEVTTATFTLDTDDLNSRFFSYASMILPSNDAFVSNGNPEAVRIFDDEGNFIGADFIIAGNQVLDAGTEVNDEAEDSTAFFGQSTPNTGIDQNGVVTLHPGFVEGGRILSEDGSSPLSVAPFTNADFTAPGYQVARITVSTEELPLPIADPVRISSNLDGSQEVSGGDAENQGTSVLTLNDRGDALEYSLTISGFDLGANGLVSGGAITPDDTSDDVTKLHIHTGGRGENGPLAFVLFDITDPELGNQLGIVGNQDEDLNITLNDDGSATITGVWEETDAASTPLSDFVAEIREAEVGEDLDLYYNVHTEEFPGGAIRGQLVVTDEDNDPPVPDLVEVTVSIENLAPENGTFLTPFWVGFHDGNFDTYDRGRPASEGLERLAEDGNTNVISREFISSGAGVVDGTIAGSEGTPGPIDPGENTSFTFTLDRSLASSRFFNYASMVLPSNDAFVANGNPQAREIFDENGNFLGADFVITGNQVLDAGTEVNDEAENSTAFFSQSSPNTGTDENGVVQLHPGFKEGGRILSEPRFANTNFSTDGYELARIKVTINDNNVPTVPQSPIFQDNGRGEEVVDLTNFNNQPIQTNVLEVTTDAAFDNVVGFYAIEDVNGTVLDEFGNALTPGDEGYAEAAIRSRVVEITKNTTGSQEIGTTSLLAPFIIANGTTEEFLSNNPDNLPGESLAYFTFLGANPDGVEHIRLLEDNTFGFEDLFGGGDRDFNDLTFRAEFTVM